MREEVQENIKNIILDSLSEQYKGIKNFSDLIFSELTTNDYSFCFQLSFNSERLYVKIPKRNQAYLSPEERKIFPITEEDINFAKDEYSSLLKLNSLNEESKILKIIEPIKYIEDINAIVSQEFIGKDFFIALRRYTASSPLNQRRIRKASESLAKAIVSICSSKPLGKEKYPTSRLKEKILKYTNIISDDSFAEKDFDNKIINMLSLRSVAVTTGYKGFDIRNILLSDEGEVCILDPGKEKLETQEAFIARFYATLLILFWGSPLFFFKYKVHADLLEIFDKVIYENLEIDRIALLLELRKELLKHWSLALRALAEKKWPGFFKKLIKKTYINNFYKSSLDKNKKTLINLID
jgi:hypothetical protein